MQKWILAVSPEIELLEQISAHLQEGGRFLVISAANGKEALTAAGSQQFDLAILDGEISDLPFVPLTRELTALIPNLKILVFPPNNNSKHPVLNGLMANGFLNKPFFGPEVSGKIGNLFKDNPPLKTASQLSEESLPDLWVEYPDQSARQIEQLVGATSASAGLLLLRGQVIAGTGVLSDEAAGNIVNFLTRYWTNIQSGELFRFLKMNHETATYLVYAVPLFKNVAIGLIYHPEVALEDIRAEVTRLRKGFLDRYTNTGELRHDFPINDPLKPDLIEKSGVIHGFERIKTHPIPQEDQRISTSELEEEIQSGLSEKDLSNLDAMLAEMPPPDPEVELPTTHPLVEDLADEELEAAQENESLLSEFAQNSQIEFEAPPTLEEAGTEDVLPVSLEQEETPVSESKSKTAPLPPLPEQATPAEQFPDFDFKLPWEDETSPQSDSEEPVMPPPLGQVSEQMTEVSTPPLPPIIEPVIPLEEETVQTEENTIPPPLPKIESALDQPVSEPIQQIQPPPLEIPSPGAFPDWVNDFISLEDEKEPIQPCELLFRYNFILLPRNPGQFITHDLAEILNQSMPKFHQANNWEFISISIRPLYLQWSAAFPLSVAVSSMIAEIRNRTNDQIFTSFPRLLETHSSADFWANGYFAISGSHSPSNRLINDYISLSRQVPTF